eukprot:scaffold24708_cov67-Phaeocystis_antarctica.AAC.8
MDSKRQCTAADAAATAAGEARPEAAVGGAAAVAAAAAAAAEAAAAAAVRGEVHPAGGTASTQASVYSRCRWRWRSLAPCC